MLTMHTRQHGLTLVELMIASAIGLITLATVVTVYSTTAAHSTRELRSSHLYQQLSGLLQFMADDLRRAGYRHFDPALESPADNPFQSADHRLRTGAWPGETADSCVLYTWDLDEDGRVGIGRCSGRTCPAGTDADNSERFGFRLRRGQLQSRYGGREFRCDAGSWQAVNDPEVEITSLQFVTTTRCANLVVADAACRSGQPASFIHSVEIRIQGQLRHRPDSRLVLRQPVHVRNDRLVE